MVLLFFWLTFESCLYVGSLTIKAHGNESILGIYFVFMPRLSILTTTTTANIFGIFPICLSVCKHIKMMVIITIILANMYWAFAVSLC